MPRYFLWKIVLGFMLLPPLLNVILLIIVFSHFTTFNGAPISEFFANALLYVGNWPSFLFKMYPYVLSIDGEVVYEAFPTLAAFIIDLIGWGFLGFCFSYAIQKLNRKNEVCMIFGDLIRRKMLPRGIAAKIRRRT